MNTTLSRLDLSGNAVDQSGTEAIAEALEGNSGLESLRIRYVHVLLFGKQGRQESNVCRKEHRAFQLLM